MQSVGSLEDAPSRNVMPMTNEYAATTELMMSCEMWIVDAYGKRPRG